MRKVFLVALLVGVLVVISGCTQQGDREPSPSPTQAPITTTSPITITQPPTPIATATPSPIKTVTETPTSSLTTSPTTSSSPTNTQSPLPSISSTPTISTKLDKDTATQKLIQAGCGYNLSWEDVCIVFEDPEWIMQKEGCGGKCKIDSVTGKTEIYDNPMCTGLLISNECQTDANCSTRRGACAVKFVCEETSCIPVFK